MKRSSQTLTADMLFKTNVHIFVNRALEDFDLPLHAHDFIEFAYVAEGRGFHHIEEEVQPVHKGQLFVLPVGISHVFRPASADSSKYPLVVYNCVFTASALHLLTSLVSDPEIEAYLRSLQHSDRPVCHSVRDRDGTIEKLLLKLHQEYRLPRKGSQTFLYALLLQLVIETYRLQAEAVPPPPELQTPDVEGSVTFSPVLQYIERHYPGNVTLAELAGRSQWSERQLQRLFLQFTGQSFRSYLQNVRIQKSCELLRTTGHKISAIAETVGYKDMDSFNAVFKRIVGTTPNEFRQQSRKK